VVRESNLDRSERIPVGARFSAPIQTGPEAHSASYTILKERTRGDWSFKKDVALTGEAIYSKRNIHRTPESKTPLGRPRRVE